jgi:membrane protein implicated in regulation of membrane protease activity
MCHIVLVVPLAALALFAFLPVSQALVLYLPVLLLCAIVYWVVWKDSRRPVACGIEGMVGGMAQVMENGAGRIKVFYRGEIWDALCTEPLSTGEKVEITGMEQMKLIVRRHASVSVYNALI